MINVTTKDYERYQKMARVICTNNFEEADELLQNLLLKFIEKDLPQEKLTDNLVFISLKNAFLNKKIKDNNSKLQFEEELNYELEDDNEIEKKEIKEKEMDIKLEMIENEYKQLKMVDTYFFDLYFFHNLKIVEIAEKTGISKHLIGQRLKKIKKNIKNGE